MKQRTLGPTASHFGGSIFILFFTLCCPATTCTESEGPTRALGLFKPGVPTELEAGFIDPPAISRPQCWWQCFGSPFTKDEIKRQLTEFKNKGMGGVTIKDTTDMPRDKNTEHIKNIRFMSEEWLDMYKYIVDECTRLGLICRSRMGSGWNAGGPWVTDELASQNLSYTKSKIVQGPCQYSAKIPIQDGKPNLEEMKKDEAFVIAVNDSNKTSVVLTEKVNERLELNWSVPQGKWEIISFYPTLSEIKVRSASTSGQGLHHDHLSEAGTDLQIENVAVPMLNKLGAFDNTAFDGFNLDSWELGNPTWTSGLRKIFKDRCGYDPVGYLHYLRYIKLSKMGRHDAIEPSISDEGLRFIYDYRTTVSDLIIKTHYRRINQWCRKHGVALEAQAGGPAAVPNDLLCAQGSVSVPMGEFWMDVEKKHPITVVKIASSAAHTYGQRLVGMESFTSLINQFEISPQDMKRRVDEAFLLGGNYITLAVVEYSPQEAGLPGWVHGAGPHINHCQTWWAMVKGFMDYLSRGCFMLQSGRNVSDVAVYCSFRKPKIHGIWESPWKDGLEGHSNKFAFDYVNDDLIQNHMRSENGRIVLDSGATYQLLYIHPNHNGTIPLATMQKIRDIVHSGVTVVWAGPVPERCPSLIEYPKRDEQLRRIVQDLWNDKKLIKIQEHNYELLVPFLENSPNPPGWQIPENNTTLRFVHRKTKSANLFFVVNRADQPVESQVLFRVTNRMPELWILESGEIQPVAYDKSNEGIKVNIKLPAYGSAFVVFRKNSIGAPSQKSFMGKLSKAIEINGKWVLNFPKGQQMPEQIVIDKLESWTDMKDPGIRHFSGIGIYKTTFRCDKEAFRSKIASEIDLGIVAEVGRVFLNDKEVGVCWHSPYRLDISGLLKEGENKLEVHVANLWHNRLVGDAMLPVGKRVTQMAPESRYNWFKNKKLLQSGLLGPVRIEFNIP